MSKGSARSNSNYRLNACAINCACSRLCTASEPTAGLALAFRPAYVISRRKSAHNFGSMKLQAPMFCDSSWHQIAFHLAAHHVKILGGRRDVADLDVVLRARLKKALEPRAGMLRPLSFITVRQQHHDAAGALPFRFGADDELIDDRLRAIREIAELRFPEAEHVRIIERVTVIESEHRGLGEETVVNANAREAVDNLPQHFGTDRGRLALAGILRLKNGGRLFKAPLPAGLLFFDRLHFLQDQLEPHLELSLETCSFVVAQFARFDQLFLV